MLAVTSAQIESTIAPSRTLQDYLQRFNRGRHVVHSNGSVTIPIDANEWGDVLGELARLHSIIAELGAQYRQEGIEATAEYVAGECGLDDMSALTVATLVYSAVV